MKKTTVQSLWAAHRALGVLLGVLIFTLFLTGTTSVFRDELRLWSSPATLAGEGGEAIELDGASVQKAIERFAEHHPLEQSDRWALFLPLYPQGVFELIYRDPGQAALVRAYVRGGDFAYLGQADRTPGEFLFNLHANLTLRGKLGRVSVGLLGLVCLFLVLTGVLIHRHKLRNAFAFRGFQSLRRGLGDAHRALGLWGLPFLAVISFSGAALGLKSLLLLLPTAVEFRGDLARAKQEIQAPPVRASGESAQMQPVALLWERSLSQARRAEGGEHFVPTLINARAWGDKNAQWSLGGSLTGALAPQNEAMVLRFGAQQGKFLGLDSVHERGWPHRVYSSMAPLHYGDFGGWPLKFLYAGMGLCGAFLVASGLMIWAQRKERVKVQPQ